MKKLHILLSLPLAFTALGSSIRTAHAAPISITTLGTTYLQDFNGLASTGASSTGASSQTPGFPTTSTSNILFAETGTAANGTYSSGTGSSATGDTYSFGNSTAPTDRAFGTLQSGSVVPTIGLSYTNNTGSVLNNVNIMYRGEQYRLGTAGRADRLDFQYSTNATDLLTGTYIDSDNGDFSSPVTTGTGALDGNATGNFTNLNFNLFNLQIADGATFFFRFSDFNATGADDGLAVDDFMITAANDQTITPEPETWAMMAMGIGALAMFGWKRKRDSEGTELASNLAI